MQRTHRLDDGAPLARPYYVYRHQDGHESVSVSAACLYVAEPYGSGDEVSDSESVARSLASLAVSPALSGAADVGLGPPSPVADAVGGVPADLTDLSDHVTYFERPPLRPPPRRRRSVSPAGPVRRVLRGGTPDRDGARS